MLLDYGEIAVVAADRMWMSGMENRSSTMELHRLARISVRGRYWMVMNLDRNGQHWWNRAIDSNPKKIPDSYAHECLKLVGALREDDGHVRSIDALAHRGQSLGAKMASASGRRHAGD